MVVADRATRLNEFVIAWRTLTRRRATDVERLTTFLDAAGHRLRPSPPIPTSVPKLDPAMLKLKLGELQGALNRARSHGFGFNPWTVAGLRRNEVRACGVLAALWNPLMCGNGAVQFLKEFVGELCGPIALPDEDELRQGYIVRTEHSVLGDRTTRMDITIEGTAFVLVIEVKIDAPEGRGDGKTDQFPRVRAQTEAWAKDRDKRPLFVLLSPWKPAGGFGDIHSDWRAIARAARRCLPHKRSTYTFHDHMLDSFARHVASF